MQNIELVQHWGHRLAGVAKVRLDTGTGADADAELAVLSLDAVQQLRDAVRQGRRGDEAPGAEQAARAPDVLAALGLRELALHGLLTSRGLVVIAAIAGALWQADLDGWRVGRYLPSIRGVWRDVATSTPRVLVELAVLGLVIVLIFRLLSAAWSVIKHFDFSLIVRGAELFQSYGLLTRVGRTIPRARIQKLTVTDDPLMRLLGRATVSVDTAASVGGPATPTALGGSQVLVPILPWARVPTLVRDVHPSGAIADLHDLEGLDWQGVDDRTFRRLVRVRLAFAMMVGIGLWFAIGWWALLAAGVLGTVLGLKAYVAARFTAFAWSGETLIFRSSNGWKRQHSLVRSARMQVVSVRQSPLDRRWGMKRVHVDTAGAAGGGHQMDIPWLTGSVADALYVRLRHAASPGENAMG